MFAPYTDLAPGPCPELSKSNPQHHNVLCKQLLLFASHVRLRFPSDFLFFLL